MANYQFNNLPDKRTQLQYLQKDQKSRGSDDILMPSYLLFFCVIVII